MTVYRRVACLKVQPNDNNNRITIEWQGPDGIWRTYAVNQRTLKRYDTPEELKAALDDWTFKSFGYVLDDVFCHLNDDGVTWAIATGEEPDVWPEDVIEP
jgi:hypothetical protein